MPYVALVNIETRSSGDDYVHAIEYGIGDTLDESEFSADDISHFLSIKAISGP